MAELEKLGAKYRIALQIARDERWERLQCDHKGTYADDCIVDRVVKQRVYLVGTNDRDLKRRLRKIPGVPIVSVARGKYVIERYTEASAAMINCGWVLTGLTGFRMPLKSKERASITWSRYSRPHPAMSRVWI